MRFLIDNALSHTIATGLCEHGHDAVHVRDRKMACASDAEIFDQAQAEQRILISTDTDFGTLLAHRQDTSPSLILFRQSDRRPAEQLRILLANLPAVADDLRDGCIRLRKLPLGPVGK